MLCDRCARQKACLPSVLAEKDPQLLSLLSRLKQCQRQIVKK